MLGRLWLIVIVAPLAACGSDGGIVPADGGTDSGPSPATSVEDALDNLNVDRTATPRTKRT
jgi:hypothetical protein